MKIKKLLPLDTPPKKIFFTGVPGSRWSGIAQEIEKVFDADCSDRTPEREYSHESFSGHKGVYFGTGMEFPAVFSETNLDAAYSCQHGLTDKCRIHKSHEWAYMLDTLSQVYPKCWIVLVYRDNNNSYKWWKEAGGWNIQYPIYDWYTNDDIMREKIQEQNELILDFANRNNLEWNQHHQFSDVFIAVWKKESSES